MEATLPELLHHLLGDVDLIAKYLALEASSQCCQGVTVMDVGGRDPYRHDLALVIDHQMELEPEEPTHGTAAPLGHASEQRQLWIRTPGLGGNIAAGTPLLEISSPPQDARKTTFSPTGKNCWILWCTEESCSAPKGSAQLKSCPIRYEPLSIIRVLNTLCCLPRAL